MRLGEAYGSEVLAIPCDVSEPDQVEAAIQQVIQRFGRLDVAFNNAGVENKAVPVHEIELTDWDRILGINLCGLFVCMKHELAQMVKQSGGVVANTSLRRGYPWGGLGAAYAAPKHAIIGLTRSAAVDHAKQSG